MAYPDFRTVLEGGEVARVSAGNPVGRGPVNVISGQGSATWIYAGVVTLQRFLIP